MSSNAPEAAAPVEPPAEPPIEPLVECEWLERRSADGDVRIVDLREAAAYAEGHIPGAVRLDLADLGTHRDGCENVMLDAPAFERLMSRLGVARDRTVIAYDDQWGLAAARLLWALHHHGHRAAGVLNGGWDLWKEGGWPITDAETPAGTTDFSARPDPEVSADRAWVSAAIDRGHVVLLDTRTQVEFADGHLPGAVCWDWFNAVPPGGWRASREAEDLRDEWAGLGVRPSDEVVVYCRSGMRAAHTYMVLKHAGFPRVRLYDGSWQDWSAFAAGSDE